PSPCSIPRAEEAHMKSGRAALLIFLALGVLIAPLAGETQQVAIVPRIGLVFIGHPQAPLARALLDAFGQGLGELGYREGPNIVIERRYAESNLEQLPQMLADLVRLKAGISRG
ncbi:MAG: hypothetical protein ACREK6_03880, partial [Candidatus Rokuibacteriota bacterium]